MTGPRAAGVTRHLNYAWIEFGHTGDGQAFTAGLDALGWKNLVRYLPRKEDAAGAYFETPNFPNLPIRWRGASRLILPNAIRDVDGYSKPWVNDPLFTAYREQHGDEACRDMVLEYCEFLANWVFNPGIKRTSDTEAELTLEGATDYADLVACSGHGSVGTVWGGDSNLSCELARMIREGAALAAGSDRLKYVLMPTCYNLSYNNAEAWLPVMRRTQPVHGILGYGWSYPGGNPGQHIFAKFAANMKANEGKTSILKAYRDAHLGGAYQGRWAAVAHASSATADTMKDWLAGALAAPDAAGELRWYCENNWPDGRVIEIQPPPLEVRFVLNGVEIDRTNSHRPDVGLFVGESGALRIKSASPLPTADWVTLTFYYYRPEKDGMNLTKLLDFTKLQGHGWSAKVSTDLNSSDNTTHADGLWITIEPPGAVRQFDIPFTVAADAANYYPSHGQHSHGLFWIAALGGELTEPQGYYPDGAWLRGART